MRDQSSTYESSERKSIQKASYLYLISNTDNGVKFFFTSHEEDITITGGASVLGSDPKTFSSHQITHAHLQRSSENQQSGVQIETIATNSEFARWLTTSLTGNITATIWRVHPTGSDIAYADIQLFFFGSLTDVGFIGNLFAGNFTSPFDQMNKPIPRHYFQRLCNHVLYGESCGVVLATYERTGITSGFNRTQRTLLTTLTESDDWYGAGFIIEPTHNMRIGIVQSSGSSGSITLKLSGWMPELEQTGLSIKAYAGCDHSTGAGGCAKFSNLPNYGGYSYISIENPSVDGV